MSRLRNWLMGLVAGRKYAYWIADDAAKDLASFRCYVANAPSMRGVKK